VLSGACMVVGHILLSEVHMHVFTFPIGESV